MATDAANLTSPAPASDVSDPASLRPSDEGVARSIVLRELARFGPERCPRLSEAEASAYVERLAQEQYENFTVVSRLLPKRLRTDFRHVYAFCRWADDLGDETGDPRLSLRLLDWWRSELDRCYAGDPRHPVFVALHTTIRKHDIPRKPFDDLVDAFVQDQTTRRYDRWDQVLDYCSRSADPVGRLVLYLCGYRDEQRQRLSDATCTALQLANFWQDVRRDVLERDRVYIPREIAGEHGLDVDRMARAIERDAGVGPMCASCGPGVNNAAPGGLSLLAGAYRDTMAELVGRTWPRFREGRKLWPLIPPDLRVDIKLFTLGGETVLRRIEAIDYDTMRRRPKVGRLSKALLLSRALVGKAVAGLGVGRRAGGPEAGA